MGKDLRHPKRIFALPRQPKTVVFREKIEIPDSVYNRDKAKAQAKELIEEELALEEEDYYENN